MHEQSRESDARVLPIVPNPEAWALLTFTKDMVTFVASSTYGKNKWFFNSVLQLCL